MTKLLHLVASPRGEQSYSTSVAEAFINAYSEHHPTHEVESIDLWSTRMPAFDGETLAAKYAVIRGVAHTPPQAEAWAAVQHIADTLKSASQILVSTPMWNFGVPYILKHYIDVVTQPGLTFSYSVERGYEGLVTGRPATVISSSGGAYHQGSGAENFDFERPYLEHWLRFIGFTDIHTIAVAPTFADKASIDASLTTARRQAEARAVART